MEALLALTLLQPPTQLRGTPVPVTPVSTVPLTEATAVLAVPLVEAITDLPAVEEVAVVSEEAVSGPANPCSSREEQAAVGEVVLVVRQECPSVARVVDRGPTQRPVVGRYGQPLQGTDVANKEVRVDGVAPPSVVKTGLAVVRVASHAVVSIKGQQS